MTECGCGVWVSPDRDPLGLEWVEDEYGHLVPEPGDWVMVDENRPHPLVKVRCVRPRAVYKASGEAPMCKYHMRVWKEATLRGLDWSEDPEVAANEWCERELEA